VRGGLGVWRRGRLHDSRRDAGATNSGGIARDREKVKIPTLSPQKRGDKGGAPLTHPYLKSMKSKNLRGGNFFGFIFGWKRHAEAGRRSAQIVGYVGLRGTGVGAMRAKKFCTGGGCSFNLDRKFPQTLGWRHLRGRCAPRTKQ